MPSGVKDIRGLKFGRWTVKGYAGTNKHRQSTWACVCSCPLATEKVVGINQLQSGKSKSCGCLFRETRRTSSMTHGGCYDLEYQPWKAMNARCYDPNNKSYPRYGGVGVTVQESWRNPHYDTFKKDMPPRPSKDYSLDRFPDKFGNYVLGNLRWATKTEQALNRKNNVLMSDGKKTQTISEWTREKKWSRSKIQNRRRLGWSDERILNTP